MNNDDLYKSKSYNVDNDLPRGEEFIEPVDMNDKNLSMSDEYTAKMYNQKSTEHNIDGAATPEGAAPEKEPSVLDDVTRYLAIGEQSILLLKELGSLASLELTRSLEAIKISIILQLLLLPAVFLLYVSFALSVTYIIHVEFGSAYLTATTLLLLQVIGILTVKHKIKDVKKRIGFQHTSEHMHEVKNELLKSIRQTN